VRETIPLFPLGSVLYPGLLLPLNVFEPRYLQLVSDLEALPEDERRFGVIAIKQGRETGIGEARQLYDVGCAAEIRRVEEQEDGRLHVVTTGGARFRLHELLTEGTPYLRADVEWLDEPDGPGDPASLRDELVLTFRAYLATLGAARQVEVELPDPPDDPAVLSYLVAATMIADTNIKQELLEAPDCVSRIQAELRLLRHETALLQKLPAAPAVELTRMPLSPN
jgi:Lon protease-like protein